MEGLSFLQSDDLHRLEELLSSFVEETRVRCAILTDRAGRLLTSAGETRGLDGIAFASLAAADFAASDELAVQLGEREFNSLYHQGEDLSMFLAEVGGQVILAALFDESTTLGMVRLKTRDVAPEFASLLAAAAASGPRAKQVLEGDWAAAAADEIDRLFAD